ncbi:TRAP transporter permease [Chloroflexota bacterium]
MVVKPTAEVNVESDSEATEHTRYAYVPQVVKLLTIIFTIVGVGMAIFHIFHFNFMGLTLLDIAYFYFLFALFFSLMFLLIPMRKKDKRKIPWFDYIFSALAFSIALYYFFNAWNIDQKGWVPPENMFQFATSFVFVLLMLEGGRRMAGWIFASIVVLAVIYPMVADSMPGLLWGQSFPLVWIMTIFTFSPQGIIGLPGQLFGNILLGFLVFAGVMISSGAGEFFLSLATSLFGRFRGGPAKVAVIASGFFGSLSGSVAANIVATGSFTIPAMKKIGYKPEYAGAIEACASTGGLIMPPVMGALAFIMAYLIGEDYGTIVVAATLPAVLYYFGLLMGADGVAAREGMRGLPPEEVPSLKETLKTGWPYLLVLFFLIWGLVWMRWETRAPFFASALMIILSFLNRKTFLTPRKFIRMVVVIGRLLAMTMCVLLPLGIIIAGLTVTGAILALTSAVIQLGQGNVILILLIAVGASYIMGMAGMGIPAYIFLAITMAPAVIQVGGLNPIGVHLFIVYYSIVSMITLPVAIGAFIAATIAGAHPMKTAWVAMRLGIVIYIIPFFFIFNPSLIMQGNNPTETIYLFVLCVAGIILITGGLEGYLLKVGNLKAWSRPLLVAAGFLIALPGWQTTIIGAIGAAVLLPILWSPRIRKESPEAALVNDG